MNQPQLNAVEISGTVTELTRERNSLSQRAATLNGQLQVVSASHMALLDGLASAKTLKDFKALQKAWPISAEVSEPVKAEKPEPEKVTLAKSKQPPNRKARRSQRKASATQ